MKINCLKWLSETTFVCIFTGVIVYEYLVGEHHDHVPRQDFNSTSTYIISTTSGTSNPSTSQLRRYRFLL